MFLASLTLAVWESGFRRRAANPFGLTEPARSMPPTWMTSCGAVGETGELVVDIVWEHAGRCDAQEGGCGVIDSVVTCTP